MVPKNDRVLTASLVLALLVCTAAYSGNPLAGGEAYAQEASPDEATAEVPETTEVGGEIPAEFLGRWVAFPHVRLPSGLVRHFARMWEIRKGQEHYEVFLHHASVPLEVNQKLDEATEAAKEWQPSPEDIQQVAGQWDDLPKTKSGYAKVENKLLAADAYPPEFKRDEVTKGSEYAVVFNEVFSGKQSIGRTYSIYAVRKREPDRVTGTFITTSMAVAPFPIPITLKGDFEAYRVSKPPPASLFQRLLDSFSGCGSR